MPATNGEEIQCQVGTGATPTYLTSGYLWQILEMYAAGNNKTGAGSANDTQAVLAYGEAFGISNSATYNGYTGVMWIGGANGTSNPITANGVVSFYSNSAGVAWTSSTLSWQQPAAIFTALKFFFSSGNITSGTIDIFGFLAG